MKVIALSTKTFAKAKSLLESRLSINKLSVLLVFHLSEECLRQKNVKVWRFARNIIKLHVIIYRPTIFSGNEIKA